jgi:diguanylate cyclase (GGDEF)-like protein
MSFRSDNDPAVTGALPRVLRSVGRLEVLLVLLAVLYVALDRAGRADHVLSLLAVAGYGAAALALRRAQHWNGAALVRPVAMVLFITVMLALSDGASGPLLNLYLLPIVMTAVVLGRGATLAILALVLASRVSLSGLVAGVDVLTWAYGLALLGEALPVLLVALLTSMLVTDLQNATERLRALSDLDDLTGVLNLEAFTRLAEAELQRANRSAGTFTLMLVDVDGLRALNERHGHEAGNRALKAVGQALQRSTRSVDLVARYGGDEFVVFLAGAAAPVARVVANRVRHHVATTTLESGGALHRVTVGVGAAVFPADGRELRDLLNKASTALVKDKDSRRPLDVAAIRASA